MGATAYPEHNQATSLGTPIRPICSSYGCHNTRHHVAQTIPIWPLQPPTPVPPQHPMVEFPMPQRSKTHQIQARHHGPKTSKPSHTPYHHQSKTRLLEIAGHNNRKEGKMVHDPITATAQTNPDEHKTTIESQPNYQDKGRNTQQRRGHRCMDRLPGGAS